MNKTTNINFNLSKIIIIYMYVYIYIFFFSDNKSSIAKIIITGKTFYGKSIASTCLTYAHVY